MNKIFTLSGLLLSALTLKAQVDVLTQRNDAYRTGLNSRETILNTSNVKPATFGKLFSHAVDDQIYAQPLIATGIAIPSFGIRNVVYVATVNNSIYAFDADSGSRVNPYWSKNLSPSGSRAPAITDIVGARCINFSGNFGIVGTPVIDKNSHTLYVVARSLIPGSPPTWRQYLHAIDITNGSEKPGSPVLINATINGTGDGQMNGVLAFNPATENQRPGLLLLKGIVYIGYSSHCDYSPYHGWLLGYDSATLVQKIVYNDTPDGGLGGIWMSGVGPAADELGNIYLATGNGTVGVGSDPTAVRNRAESFLKLTPAGNTLQVSSFFTPKNFVIANANDYDFGVVQVLLIPNTKLAISGSKEGLLFLVNRDNMGGFNASTNNVIQTINLGSYANLHASMGYYRGIKNEFVYVWSENAALTALPFNRASENFNLGNTVSSGIQGPRGQTGAFLSTSSNGPNDSTGVLWGVHASGGCDAESGVCHGILHAIDANNVKNELWNSTMNSIDDPGNLAKFVSPTVANGKVYMATFSHQLVVYGLKPAPLSAHAGGNQTIILPVNSVTLSGSANKGTVGGPVVSSLWSQRSGPSSATLTPGNALTTHVTGLVSGNYVFRLTVTDSIGNTAFDSSIVTVFALSGSSINVRLYAGSFPYQNPLWNNWNIGTGVQINKSSGILKNSDGSTGTISAMLSYQDNLADNGGAYTSGATMCPDTVLRYTSYTSSTRMLTINGLNNATKYNLEFYASRNMTDGQNTTFAIGNQSITVSTDVNTSNAAKFSAISPSSGSITITISRNGVYNYLNGFKITSNLINSPPTVSAGGNQTILAPANPVTLSAAATKGGGGPIVSTTWSELSGPNAANLLAPGSLSTRASNLIPGTYQFQILVRDSVGSTASSTTMVRVQQPIIPPTVSAGGNQTILAPANSVTLSATATKGGGGPIVSTTWSELSGPNAANLLAPGSLSTTASNLIPGTYQFQILVRDSVGSTASSTTMVRVQQPIIPPTVSAGGNQTILAPANSVTLSATANKGGGGPIVSTTWSELSGPNAANLLAPGSLNTTASSLIAGTYQFQILVRDSAGSTASSATLVLVQPAIPPKVNAGGNQTIFLPTNSTTLMGTAAPGSGGPFVSTIWAQKSGPTNSSISSPNSLSTQVSGLVAGSYVFTLDDVDSVGEDASDSAIVTVTPTVGHSVNVRFYSGSFPFQNPSWNNWNIGTGPQIKRTSGILKYSDGSASPVNAMLSYQDNLADNGGIYTSGATMCPDTVLRYASYTTSTRMLTISGLNNANKYNLEFYASRNRTDGQNTIFTIASQSITVSTDVNTSNAAKFSAISPSGGSITITISRLGIYNYINGFKISDNTGNLALGSNPQNGLESINNINQWDKIWNVRIFPNPVNDNLTLLNNSSNPIKVQLFDISGRLLRVYRNIPNLHEIDMRRFAPGSYIVMVTDEKNYQVFRQMIIKQ
jgi:Secretion system C-terminal sorting domain